MIWIFRRLKVLWYGITGRISDYTDIEEILEGED